MDLHLSTCRLDVSTFGGLTLDHYSARHEHFLWGALASVTKPAQFELKSGQGSGCRDKDGLC